MALLEIGQRRCWPGNPGGAAVETGPAEEEEDGPLGDWTKKVLAGECRTLGLSDKGTKAVLISRIKEARESAVEEAPAEEAAAVEAAPAEEAVVEEPAAEEPITEEPASEEAAAEEPVAS